MIQRLQRARMSAAVALLSVCVACGGGATSSGADTSDDGRGDGMHATHAAASASDRVAMSLIAYQPERLTVPASTTVTWEQRDAGTHTVTSGTVDQDRSGSVTTDADGVFDSDELAKGDRFDFTFDRAGEFAYFCRIHPATMQGRITVE